MKLLKDLAKLERGTEKSNQNYHRTGRHSYEETLKHLVLFSLV